MNLLHQVYEVDSRRPAPNQSLDQVLRCLKGKSGLKHAFRFHWAISQHASGVICVYDSQHKMLKVAPEGAVIAELVQESTDSDAIYRKYRNQLLRLKNGRDASVIEF